ncbi:MAG: hypothetical protein KC615_05225 [Anaerolineae bacterium]|nr:hypothetical protein [Anaerolineae bacterium]
METNALHQFLILFSWFPLAAFILLVLLIARFYQRFSGEQTYFWLFIVPIVAFGVVAVRQAGSPSGQWDIIASLVAAIAGLILLVLVYHLYARMIAHSKKSESEQANP